MPYDFKGKVCLVTGAASGIGRATALKMSSLGATLSLSDINSTSLSETKVLCGDDSIYLQDLNVGSSSACSDYVNATVEKFGRLDYVFNCAGVNPTAYPLTETTDEYWDKLINTNLRGTYNITRAAMPHLKSGASIVNVSSIMGIGAAAEYAIYCTTKHGIVGFTKAMALELGKVGVRVNAVAPGYIDTPSNAGVVEGPEAVKAMASRVSLGRLGTAGEVADVVAYLFRYVLVVLCLFDATTLIPYSDESRYVNGSIVEVHGGRKV